MKRGWKFVFFTLAALILLLAALMLTVTHWLPRVAGWWLPAGTRISLQQGPRLHQGRLTLAGLRYLAGECELADVSGITLRHQAGRWQLDAGTVRINSRCFASLPASEQASVPRSLADWQQLLPPAAVNINHFELADFSAWAGALLLEMTPQQQTLRYQGKRLQLVAELQQQQLTLKQLNLTLPGIDGPVSLQGAVTLPLIPDSLPRQGALTGQLSLAQIPQPLALQLNWQQQQGTLTVKAAHQTQPLLMLPWQITSEQLRLLQGEWRWPWGAQPLAGGISMTADNWQQGLAATTLQGRINLLTRGRGGKGNAVLNIGPGRLDWQNSQLPLQLYGEAKLAALQFYAGLQARLQGALTDPKVEMQPGSLLRMKGRLLSTLEVDEARWPLAGVSVSAAGINGRLQAILRAYYPETGHFRLHLDGKASDFWPDKGQWLWRYWGDGLLLPLAAKWDVSGYGGWFDTLIELKSLSTGFNQLHYGSVTMASPRLTLRQPLRWQRAADRSDFSGELLLNARRTRFTSGGYWPASQLNLQLKGRDPNNFLYQGRLQTRKTLPLQLRGRWDGERLRGEAWWPQQPLQGFQSLINPDTKLALQNGSLRAQAAFSASSQQGFTAGGHILVSNGSLLLPDNQISGVDFSLPFRLQQHRWYFGTHGPVALRIKEVANQFRLQDITADLRGSYPWSDRQPLRLSNVSLKLLGGDVSMSELRLPQREAATIFIHHLSLSELITAIKPKQIAMSGHINGELPLWLNNSQWLVKDGWIANSGPLTLRLDKDTADNISQNNMAAGAAMDWLRYMEIASSRATLDLDNIGWMTMTARVEGVSQFSNKKQKVDLHYSQRENLFQLWRSLRFGDNLSSWLQENASLPSQKENK